MHNVTHTFEDRKTSDKQISKTIQGFFKEKVQFSRTKFIQQIGILYPFFNNSACMAKHTMESFTIFTFSAMVDHVILYFLQQHFEKWLASASEEQK